MFFSLFLSPNHHDHLHSHYPTIRPHPTLSLSLRMAYARMMVQLSDIATRRRLSTPKASPLPSRAPSTTHYHQQHHHQHLHQPHSHPNHNANTSTLSKSSSSRTSGATSGVTTTASPSARPAVPNRRPVAVPPKKSAWYRSLERLTSPMKLHHKATSSTPTMRLSQSTSTLNKVLPLFYACITQFRKPA